MHALHKLLVDVMQYQNGDETIFRIPREYAADLVRQYAEEETKCYKNIAYHYRVTLTAVSWSRQYPKNIIFGRDNPKLYRYVRRAKNKRFKEFEKYWFLSGIWHRTDNEKNNG